jgi:RimJ/RimL family protein N-acetyltransferase
MAARAARLIANWAHNAGYSEIRLATFVDNIVSQRTAANAGFIATGRTVRDIKGQPRDLITWQFQPGRSQSTR